MSQSVGASSVLRNVQKMFVGNLPWTVGNRDLQLYFSKFGHVSSATVVFDKTKGMSKGYGFVVFSTRDGFNSATNKINHQLDGRIINIQTANN